MSGPELAWFKSSHSGTEGDSCVEIAFSWRKSSYSGTEGDDCVEVGAGPGAVHVRDSKDKESPQITFGATMWSTFLQGTSRN
ncbi:DUF397 domain-containing protein [Embleya sp. NPDC008237]|uniref:DUF397 domain-containing protein n=1 Tax=Embleya sp. NPDC008237 TaxID=3363978 RepID=UPI0036E00E83